MIEIGNTKMSTSVVKETIPRAKQTLVVAVWQRTGKTSSIVPLHFAVRKEHSTRKIVAVTAMIAYAETLSHVLMPKSLMYKTRTGTLLHHNIKFPTQVKAWFTCIIISAKLTNFVTALKGH